MSTSIVVIKIICAGRGEPSKVIRLHAHGAGKLIMSLKKLGMYTMA